MIRKEYFYFFVFLFFVFCLTGCGAKKTPAAVQTPVPEIAVSGLTMETISQHGTADDCWLAINNNIYNVTDYIQNHPGGKAIVPDCGKDATAMFNGAPHNHSDYARQLLAEYYIGDLKK